MKTIVCFGDSNTHGFDTANGGRFPFEKRWTGVLQAALGESCRVAEEGLSGRTAVFDDPLTEGMNGLRAITPCLMTHEPVDCLVVMLGTNDTKQRYGATAQNIAKGFARFLVKALQTPAWGGKPPKILAVCPAPIKPVYREGAFFGEMGEGCDEKAHALAPLYRSAAQAAGCAFLDAGSILSMRELDGMHMDEEGHRILGLAVAEEVKRLL